ncbi:MAG: hypothetical protein FWB99_04185 [Treponema sp.]|nr:hypothetical protein [Treponema sp.]
MKKTSGKAARFLALLLLCVAAALLNRLIHFLAFDTLGLPLFIDTIFTAAVTFYAGLIPGLATVLLFQIYWSFLADGDVSPFIIVTLVEVIIIWRLRPDSGPNFGPTWPGLHGKRAFAESVTVFAGLMLLYIAASVSASVTGGLVDYVGFTRAELYRRFFAPNDVFRLAFYGSGFHPLAVAILSRFPINLIDRAIVVFGGFFIAVGMGKVVKMSSE